MLLIRPPPRFKHLLKSLVLSTALAGDASAAEPSGDPDPEPSTTQEPAEEEPQTEAERRRHERAERRANRKVRWTVLPGAFYSQETSVGFAAFGSLTFDLAKQHPDTWSSTVTATAVYTLRNQASFSVWTELYFGPANQWSLETALFLEHFPTNYYGVGPTAEPSYQVYTRRQFRSDIVARRRVTRSLFLGLTHHIAFVGIPDVEPATSPKGEVVWTADDQLGSGNVVGGEGTRIHGMGAHARWDTRDNNQSTRQGLLVDVEVAHHPRWAGSQQGFGYSRLDVRGFVPVWRGTIGVQSLSQVGWGVTPFTSMFELGGDRMLRGMFQGRFRERGAATLQLEARMPIVWRFGLAAFAGTGHVFENLTDLALHTPRWSVGGGIRFELDPENHNTLRLDVGTGPDGTGFIFTFGEAF